MNRFIAVFTLVVALAGAASAQTSWNYDKAHSAVRFTVTHMVVSEVSGRFDTVDVKFTQTADDFAGSSLEATIRTASVNTDNGMRDKHLRSDDFFNAEKFPTLAFKSTAFEKTGPNTFKVTGNLTMRDVTKQVVLDAKLTGKTVDGYGNNRIGFKATTSVNRQEYGLKWAAKTPGGDLVVSDNVDITLTAEFVSKVK